MSEKVDFEHDASSAFVHAHHVDSPLLRQLQEKQTEYNSVQETHPVVPAAAHFVPNPSMTNVDRDVLENSQVMSLQSRIAEFDQDAIDSLTTYYRHDSIGPVSSHDLPRHHRKHQQLLQ